ncbi:MAG: hypothetical protein M4579_004187 [Chaenotheca gracillima]|nr:MAG: hypothetical protein M4579_004187 [Chaenotheca gracillima]
MVLPFEKRLLHSPVSPVNLDFDARVPIPFSVFPSSYRSDAVESTTKVRVEGELDRSSSSRVGREGQESRYTSYEATLPHRKDLRPSRVDEEDLTVYEEDRRRRGPRRYEEEFTVVEEDRRRPRDSTQRRTEFEFTRERHRDHEPASYSRTEFDIEHRPGTHYAESDIDLTERDYRQRTQPIYAEQEFGQRDQSTYPRTDQRGAHVHFDDREDIVHEEPEKHHRSNMGYYDDDGQHHSFRHGLHKAADRIFHPRHPSSVVREEVIVDEEDRAPRASRVSRSSRSERAMPSHTITIPCHHIRLGDLLILQGRPCQVIRITTSSQTGQHRYLGVDLFTKQLHEESSFVSNPSPSVIVQNMLGPVFKQYRVLDIRDDGRVVAMTETGDVKQGLPIIDQGGLWNKLNDAFANGRGSLRVLVVSDGDYELAVDYKIMHGARL